MYLILAQVMLRVEVSVGLQVILEVRWRASISLAPGLIEILGVFSQVLCCSSEGVGSADQYSSLFLHPILRVAGWLKIEGGSFQSLFFYLI